MARLAPIYRDHDETYRADTCAPLVEAAAKGAVRLEALVHGHYPGRRLPREALPGIKTVGYWDAVENQDWGLPWHRNEGIELTFLESGSVAFALEDRTFALQPDDLTMTRPWQRHRVGVPCVGASRLHWLIIDMGVRRPNQSWKWPPWILLSQADLDELSDVLRHNERPVWRASEEVRRSFQAIGLAVESDRKGSNVSRLTVRINPDYSSRAVCFFSSPALQGWVPDPRHGQPASSGLSSEPASATWRPVAEAISGRPLKRPASSRFALDPGLKAGAREKARFRRVLHE